MDPDFNVSRMTLQRIVEANDLSQPFQMNQYIKDDKDCNDVTPNASAAFLGPNLWDDIKTQFVDIDNFFPKSPTDGPHLIENLDSCLNKDAQKQWEGTNMQIPAIPEAPPSVSLGYSTESIPEAPPSVSIGYSTEFVRPNQAILHPATYSPTQIQRFPDMNEKSKDYSVDCKFSPTDLALATPPGDKHYDPTSKCFPEEELKPQPIIKKSRKNFVPDDLKDEKYWARRHKNNIAAKRSREARRLKENQIVLRASYLEKENNTLKEGMIRLQAKCDMLEEKVTKFESLFK